MLRPNPMSRLTDSPTRKPSLDFPSRIPAQDQEAISVSIATTNGTVYPTTDGEESAASEGDDSYLTHGTPGPTPKQFTAGPSTSSVGLIADELSKSLNAMRPRAPFSCPSQAQL